MTQLNCDIDNLLKLTIDRQRLSGVLRIESTESSNSITREALNAYLGGCEINAQCILQDNLDQLIDAVNKNPTQPHEMIVVKGKSPVQGDNAVFQFSDRLQARVDEISKREEAFRLAEKDNTIGNKENDEDEVVDFYNASPFLIVSQGEIIGQVISSSPGEDGIDVTGQAIPTKQGKDLSDLIDKSLKRDSQGNIIAVSQGHLTYNSMKLRINPTLDIKGHVDFSTGNIDFPSDVFIHEGVRDRFSVKSGESIEIQKLVEASTLESSKDITLHNGMAGRDSGTITAGNDLKAGYLDGVHASITGDCHVAKEITNCTIKITGRLESPTAALRGGELSATHGGVVGSLGSVQGVKTSVVIGWIPEIEDKIKFAQELRVQLEKSIEKQISELETIKTSVGKPNPEQATEIWFMDSEIEAHREKLTNLDTAIDRLEQIIRANTSHSFEIKSIAYAKSTIWLPGFLVTFEDDVRGEFVIGLDKARKPTVSRNGTTSPLHTVARVIANERILPLAPPKAGDNFSDDSDDAFLEAA